MRYVICCYVYEYIHIYKMIEELSGSWYTACGGSKSDHYSKSRYTRAIIDVSTPNLVIIAPTVLNGHDDVIKFYLSTWKIIVSKSKASVVTTVPYIDFALWNWYCFSKYLPWCWWMFEFRWKNTGSRNVNPASVLMTSWNSIWRCIKFQNISRICVRYVVCWLSCVSQANTNWKKPV